MAEQKLAQVGMRVRDVTGETLGKVTRRGVERFLVRGGIIAKEALIVPDRYVAVIHEDEVVLNVTHRRLMDEMRHPPDHAAFYIERYPYIEEHVPGASDDLEAPPPPKPSHPVVRHEYDLQHGSSREYEIRPDRPLPEEPELQVDEPTDSMRREGPGSGGWRG